MTDTWHNTWDRAGQPRPWDTETMWRRWEKARRETLVDLTPGEIAMPENTNNTQAAGQQQRVGWGQAAAPLPAETLETYAAADNPHMRSMARELILHRKDAFERQVKAQHEHDTKLEGLDRLAEVGHASPRNEGVAITQVANLLGELLEWRNGKRRLPGTQAMTLDGGKVVVWGGQADMSYLHGLLDELGEWRTGKRRPTHEAEHLFAGGHAVHGKPEALSQLVKLLVELNDWRDGKLRAEPTIEQRRQEERAKSLHEVLTGLGWTPPRS